MAQCESYIATEKSQGYFIGKFKRCTEHARFRLVAPDGFKAGKRCPQHGNEIVAEYKEKLGEIWELIPLSDIENI